jgi:hypothetical protein
VSRTAALFFPVTGNPRSDRQSDLDAAAGSPRRPLDREVNS